MNLRCLGALLFLPLGDRGYRLNDLFPLDPGGDVSAVEVSADGAWIVYVADAEADDVENLWSVPADGSAAPRRLTDFTAVSGGVAGVTISPDGARVLYSTTLQLPRPLFSVPVDGSAASVELVGPHVIDFQVTPDSSRVVFIGDIYTDDRFILCSLPIDGSAGPVVLNGPLPAGGDVEEFAIAPDGTRVVHRAAGNLFSSPVDASGGALQLNPALAAGGAVVGFCISADGSRVVYRADQTTRDVVELFSVPVDASAPPIGLNPAPVAGGDVLEDPAISADGTRVVYRADQATDEVVELFGVPLDGSAAAVRLNDPLAAGEDVHAEFRIAQVGGRVAFLAGPAGAATLFTAPLDGSAAPLALDSDPQFLFTELAIGLNGPWVFYRKPDAAGSHLWSVPLDGSAAASALSAGEDLLDFRMVLGGAALLEKAPRYSGDPGATVFR